MSSSLPSFKASGKQGCVFQGRFDNLKNNTCETVKPKENVSPANPNEYATKFMNDEVAYEKEMKAARLLTAANADKKDVSFAVYAVRGCKIAIENILSDNEIERCGGNKIQKEKLQKGNGYAIEMPFVISQTLKDYNVSLTKQRAIDLFTELKNAIETLQSLGIYHCDLHPGNVWIDHIGKIRIADYGSAEFEKSARIRDVQSAGPSLFIFGDWFHPMNEGIILNRMILPRF